MWGVLQVSIIIIITTLVVVVSIIITSVMIVTKRVFLSSFIWAKFFNTYLRK